MYKRDSIDLYAAAYVSDRTTESRILWSGHKILDSTIQFECPDRLSQEKYVRRWERSAETHGYRICIHICVISALGVAGTHSHHCIADYNYRNAAGKTINLVDLLIRHMHTHIWGIFTSKRELCELVSDWRSIDLLARYKNYLPRVAGQPIFPAM